MYVWEGQAALDPLKCWSVTPAPAKSSHSCHTLVPFLIHPPLSPPCILSLIGP